MCRVLQQETHDMPSVCKEGEYAGHISKTFYIYFLNRCY